jgi:deazaflavin-dependent oxidoreductase (nitroreductase family)
MAHYRRPGFLTRNVMNVVVKELTRLGVSVWGSRVLRIRGRRTGQWRETPVNLLTYEDARYLVSPRGETDWVRNLRAAGQGELLLGRRLEPFSATELPVEERPPVLRAYLQRWKAEVGIFFSGVSATSPEEDVQRIAADHPVFRIEGAGPATD